MSYRQQRGGGGGGRYDANIWMSGNGWESQPMWQGGGGHHGGGQGGYGHHQQGGYGNQGGGHSQGGYYQPGPPQRQGPPRHTYQQPSRPVYSQRPPQQQHQGLPVRGVKRPAQQGFNNGGVTVVKRSRGGRGPGGRGPRKETPKKENKDECVVLDDTEKKAQEGFCKICQEKFDGTYNQHKLTKPHREKRAQKYPSCGPCGLKFNGDDARQRYEVHLGSKAHMQVVETAELDIKEGQEPEGTELCEPIEAVICSLCECVFKKELVETHCKTKGHLKRITKKKAEADRAAKKAEEDAKKAAGGDVGDGENGNEENGDEGDEGDEEFGQDDEEDVEGGATAAATEEAAAEASVEPEAPVEQPVEEEPPVVEEPPAPEVPVKAQTAKRGRGRGRGRGRK